MPRAGYRERPGASQTRIPRERRAGKRAGGSGTGVRRELSRGSAVDSPLRASCYAKAGQNLFALREMYQLFQAADLGSQNAQTEAGQGIVAPALFAGSRFGAFLHLDNQSILEHTLD